MKYDAKGHVQQYASRNIAQLKAYVCRNRIIISYNLSHLIEMGAVHSVRRCYVGDFALA